MKWKTKYSQPLFIGHRLRWQDFVILLRTSGDIQTNPLPYWVQKSLGSFIEKYRNQVVHNLIWLSLSVCVWKEDILWNVLLHKRHKGNLALRLCCSWLIWSYIAKQLNQSYIFTSWLSFCFPREIQDLFLVP